MTRDLGIGHWSGCDSSRCLGKTGRELTVADREREREGGGEGEGGRRDRKREDQREREREKRREMRLSQGNAHQ
jgi:hypothetical protein